MCCVLCCFKRQIWKLWSLIVISDVTFYVYFLSCLVYGIIIFCIMSCYFVSLLFGYYVLVNDTGGHFYPICFFPFCFWLVPKVLLLELNQLFLWWCWGCKGRHDDDFFHLFSIWRNLCLHYGMRTQNSIFIWKIKCWWFWSVFVLCSLTVFNSAYFTGVSVFLVFKHPSFVLWSEN